MFKKGGTTGKKVTSPVTSGEQFVIEFYEARSTVTGPCGHRHQTIENAEKCARSFAASYKRKNPNNVHTYWHVASVDSNGIRRRVGDDV